MVIIFIIMGIGYKPVSSQLLLYQTPLITIGQMDSVSHQGETVSSENIAIKVATKDKSWMWKEPVGGLVGGMCLGFVGGCIGYLYEDARYEGPPQTGVGIYLGATGGYSIGAGLGVAFTGHFIEKNRDSWVLWLAAMSGSVVGFGPFLASGLVPITSTLGSVIAYRIALNLLNRR